MTTASELKSAAVVEVESEVRKTDALKTKAKKNNNAMEIDERCSRHDDTSFETTFLGTTGSTTGSTTATATSQVAFTKAEAKRLSVSGFPQNSRLFPTQQNPALLGRVTQPERFLRARSAT